VYALTVSHRHTPHPLTPLTVKQNALTELYSTHSSRVVVISLVTTTHMSNWPVWPESTHSFRQVASATNNTNADKMIDFAISPGVKNQDALIAAAIAYRKHPCNVEDIGGGVSLSIPYCTKQPRNQDLVGGGVDEQLPGVNPGLFGGPNSPAVALGAGMSRCFFMMMELLRLMDRLI
jgi:hypothetical protein